MKTAEEMCRNVESLPAETIELAKQVIFMRDKLAIERERLKDAPLVVEYNNGGGQSGTRENPDIVAYEHLLACYVKALKQLRDVVGVEAKETLTSLDSMRERLKVV